MYNGKATPPQITMQYKDSKFKDRCSIDENQVKLRNQLKKSFVFKCA